MKLLTNILLPPASTPFGYADKLMLFGSCFAEHIGAKLHDSFFQVACNPFGILYNPLSIAQGIGKLMDTTPYTDDELVEQGGMWHSWAHHGLFSHPSKEGCLTRINQNLVEARKNLSAANVLLLTFGTAWVYEHEGRVVGNCHKVPARHFRHRRLTVAEIIEAYAPIVERWSRADALRQIIFTVSPVRHWKDGAHQNQLSKSVLLLAVEELCTRYDCCSYFPAYEILLDELRDYRFYADDMLHPNPTAVEYIWERFVATHLSDSAQKELPALLQLRRDLNHRPLHPDTEAYRTFCKQRDQRFATLQARYPWIKK